MIEISLRITDRTGALRQVALHTPDPAAWTASAAREFVHAIMRALAARGVYQTTVTMVGPMVWTVTVEADTGTATSAPMVLSAEAAIELERLAFRLPEARDVH